MYDDLAGVRRDVEMVEASVRRLDAKYAGLNDLARELRRSCVSLTHRVGELELANQRLFSLLNTMDDEAEEEIEDLRSNVPPLLHRGHR
jgi:hypothetical protein